MLKRKESNTRALLYAALRPDESPDADPGKQLAALQVYCARAGLQAVDTVIDASPAGAEGLRSGFHRLLGRAGVQGIGHVIVLDIGRIAHRARAALDFLRGWGGRDVEVHIASWSLSTGSPEFERLLRAADDLLALDRSAEEPHRAPASPPLDRDKLRLKPLWRKLFSLLQDERYAGALLVALLERRHELRLDPAELQAVHGGYDHLILFQALGFRIKGEKTHNTMMVADVLARNWNGIKAHLRGDLHEILSGFETGALF